MTLTKKKALTFLVVIFSSLISLSPASAHVDVSATTPYDGEVFPTSPPSINIAFEGLVDPTQVMTTLRKADGSKLDNPKRSTPDGPVSKVDFTLPSLADGTYIAGYRANSSDGHVVEGEFSFSVGAAPASKLVLKSKQPQAGRTLEVAGRITFDIGMIVLVGSIFWMLVLFPKPQKEKKSSEKEEKKSQELNPLLYERSPEIVAYYYKVLGMISKIGLTLLTTGLVIRVGSFLAQTVPGATAKQRWELFYSKPLWKLLITLLIIYAITLICNTTKIKEESKATFYAALSFIALYTVGLVSHAADQPLPLMDAGLWACHVALISLWVGPVLVYTILKITPESKFSNQDLLIGLKQFAPLGIFSVIFASVTGAAQAWVYAGGGIPKGEYLYLIIAKISLIVLLLPLGLINNRRVAKDKAIIGKSLKYELVIMLIVIIIAGILATTTPLSS